MPNRTLLFQTKSVRWRLNCCSSGIFGCLTRRTTWKRKRENECNLNVNGVIYYHACAGANNIPCNADYVGESARSASTRNSEHFSTAQTAPGIYKSAIMQHAADSQHHFRADDLKILSRESGWQERGIRESLYIRGLAPTLNRNEGRHELPRCYDSLISKFVRKPPPPLPHQPSEPRLSTARRPPGRPRASDSTSSQEATISKTIGNGG